MTKRNVEGMKEYFINVRDENKPEAYARTTYRSEYLVRIVEKIFPEKKDFEIMELGSNVGRNIHFLQKAGYSVWGIEGSKLYFNAIQEFYPSVMDRSLFGQIENIIHNDSLMLDTYDLIFTMAVLEHIPPAITNAVFTGIKKRAKWLLTIEDEHCNNPTHFPRKYNKVFEGYGFNQVNAWNFPPLNKAFVMRLFERNKSGRDKE